jgi:hypothetical protein
MRKLANQIDWKVIVFSFFGGELDGQSLRSDRPWEVLEVVAYWTLTWKGTVGRRFDLSCRPYPSIERYEVIVNRQRGHEIHVTCQPVANGEHATDFFLPVRGLRIV